MRAPKRQNPKYKATSTINWELNTRTKAIKPAADDPINNFSHKTVHLIDHR